MIRDNIYIRRLKHEDILKYKELIHPDKLYHQFDGPYYSKMSENEIDDHIKEIEVRLSNGGMALGNKKMIVDRRNENLIGQVNWYWKSRETNWLEVGIVIFNEEYWGRGIGSAILPAWINEIFNTFPEVIRIGLSTWSGNHRMIRLAQKIGLKEEARYRKARIVNGNYYDSLSYGILKEEWKDLVD